MTCELLQLVLEDCQEEIDKIITSVFKLVPIGYRMELFSNNYSFLCCHSTRWNYFQSRLERMEAGEVLGSHEKIKQGVGAVKRRETVVSL